MTGTVPPPVATARVIRTVAEVRQLSASARQAGARVGFVPTMGAFHEGHLSLMRRARRECELVVVSIFVNPAQFNDPGDLAKYPRDEERDLAMASGAGVDVVFAPSVEEVYPGGFATSVMVSGVSEPLEGAHRGPAHFQGVATVVAKLFNVVGPHVAYFGQKDAQQALVVRRMTRDLDFPVDIIVCPTVRETDGLAMSSRNVRLAAADRPRALALKAGLDAAAALVARGERSARAVTAHAREVMRGLGVEPEYVAAVDARTLEEPAMLQGETLIAVAAAVGPVRLIDNCIVLVPG